MRYFPEGFYAALGLQLAAFWDVFGADVTPVASAPVDLRLLFATPQRADGPRPAAAAPRAIFFDWDDPPPRH
jgi:hypothetical protein